MGRAILFVLAASAVGCQGRKGPSQLPPPTKVTVAAPTREAVLEYGEYTGYTDAIQRVAIKPQVHGRLIKVHVTEGTEIPKGTLLYEIDPDEYQMAQDRAVAARDRAYADKERADAELEKAKADLARKKNLYATKAISEEEYLQFVAAEKTSVAVLAQAKASIEQAKAELKTAEWNLSHTKIYSPIDGRISRTMVTEGNLVGYNDTSTDAMVIMVDVDPIYIYFDVPERDIIEYEAWSKPLRGIGPSAQMLGFPLWTGTWSDGVIPLAAGIETEPGYPHLGWINFREPRFESGTGTLRLRGIFDNKDRKLSSGMFARVKFPRRWPHERLTVPAECVMTGQQGRFVYLVEEPQAGADPPPPPSPDPDHFLVRVVKGPVTVETGASVGRRVVVKELVAGDEAKALPANAQVIVEGFQKVRPGGYVLVPKS
jgi:multidrug efflux system membrane fusion protein